MKSALHEFCIVISKNTCHKFCKQNNIFIEYLLHKNQPLEMEKVVTLHTWYLMLMVSAAELKQPYLTSSRVYSWMNSLIVLQSRAVATSSNNYRLGHWRMFSGWFWHIFSWDVNFHRMSSETVYFQCHLEQESRAAARKPRDAAGVLFGRSSPTTFLTSIRLAMLRKATLQSSKRAGAKHNLTQNQDSKSIKVTCLESVE